MKHIVNFLVSLCISGAVCAKSVKIGIPARCSENSFQAVFSGKAKMKNLATGKTEEVDLGTFYAIYCYQNGKCDGVSAEIKNGDAKEFNPISNIRVSTISDHVIKYEFGPWRTFTVNLKSKEIEYTSILDNEANRLTVHVACT